MAYQMALLPMTLKVTFAVETLITPVAHET